MEEQSDENLHLMYAICILFMTEFTFMLLAGPHAGRSQKEWENIRHGTKATFSLRAFHF